MWFASAGKQHGLVHSFWLMYICTAHHTIKSYRLQGDASFMEINLLDRELLIIILFYFIWESRKLLPFLMHTLHVIPHPLSLSFTVPFLCSLCLLTFLCAKRSAWTNSKVMNEKEIFRLKTCETFMSNVQCCTKTSCSYVSLCTVCVYSRRCTHNTEKNGNIALSCIVCEKRIFHYNSHSLSSAL